jgi:diaminohydroxyphosphoribosylaminopyrimidine deaminase/5-amino-6-(5-phosphoribosylamino)uracil reductase
MSLLREAGIEVEAGVMQQEASDLNAPYFKYRSEGLPYVVLKLALSLDGRAAPPQGGPRWTSSDTSRRLVHDMRAAADCVMVGVGTVLTDNPRLTDRRESAPVRQPARLVIDTWLRTPIGSAVICEPLGRAVVVCADSADGARRQALEAAGASVWPVPVGDDGRIDLTCALRAAAERGLLSILAEGGPTLATSLLRSRLVDRVAFFIAPRLYGAGGVCGTGVLGPDWWGNGRRFRNPTWKGVGEDCVFEADVVRETAAENAVEERKRVHRAR